MILLEQVSRQYQVGEELVSALDKVDFRADAGEYIAVMGPSGSGKSSLLNMIGLLDQPDSGKYLLEGVDVTVLSDNKLSSIRGHKIGFIFQFFHLIPRMSARQNIELPMLLSGIDPGERRCRSDEVIKAFGLSNRAEHRPDQLSGGQRQRVAIARATIMKPQILLADEPTGNLDRASGLEVMDILEELNRQGLTLIMVTHDQELGRRASRCITMVDGMIQSDQKKSVQGHASG